MRMNNIDSILFFIFVFTVLVVTKNIFRFISTLSQKEPKPLLYSDRELISLGLSLSYIITFLKYL